jgi:hypothetical protein
MTTSPPCADCANVVERSDVPHVVRSCAACGRELHIFEPGEHGRGFKVKKGDKVVIPPAWLKLSLNPLESRGQFSRVGLAAFAADLHVAGVHRSEEGFADVLAEAERRSDELLAAFPPLAGLDINDPGHGEQISRVMAEHQQTREFWSYFQGMFIAGTREAISQGNAARAAWLMACAERFRAMVVFKEALEEVVWMGHSAKRLLEVLEIWDANKTNPDEEFWQLTFDENSYVLSQVFATPMVFIKDKAYVGGTKLDRSDARFVDYLFSAESSREAILMEIKAPTTPLLGGEYRGNRAPSRDLSGSIVQLANYRDELQRNLHSLTSGTQFELRSFRPRCALIIGNAASEVVDDAARKSFELYRRSFLDIEVVTYDELFRKVEILAELFSLKRRAG